MMVFVPPDIPPSGRSSSVGRPPAFALRVPTDADAAAWCALFDDPEVMRYIGEGRVQPLEWYERFVARQHALAASTGLCLFSVVRTGGGDGVADDDDVADDDGTVAGFVGLQPWTQEWGPTGRLELGWRLGRVHQGRGLATAAARLCLTKAIAAGIHDPISMIHTENAASIAVATRIGMRRLQTIDAPTGAGVGVYGFDLPTR